jgi:trans-aconitate methyltransferase
MKNKLPQQHQPVKKWDGLYYENHSSAQVKRALKVIERIPIQKQNDILDIGCRTDIITKFLATSVTHGNVSVKVA